MEVKVNLKFLEKDKFEVSCFFSQLNFYIDKKTQDYQPQGPNPLELFLSALSGCVGVYALNYLKRHSIEFKKIEIETVARLSPSPPLRLIDIKVKVNTDARLEDKDTFLRFIKNCPIHNTIIHTQEVEISLT
jgi:uncharacterized OsmC-like protein